MILFFLWYAQFTYQLFSRENLTELRNDAKKETR